MDQSETNRGGVSTDPTPRVSRGARRRQRSDTSEPAARRELGGRVVRRARRRLVAPTDGGPAQSRVRAERGRLSRCADADDRGGGGGGDRRRSRLRLWLRRVPDAHRGKRSLRCPRHSTVVVVSGRHDPGGGPGRGGGDPDRPPALSHARDAVSRSRPRAGLAVRPARPAGCGRRDPGCPVRPANRCGAVVRTGRGGAAGGDRSSGGTDDSAGARSRDRAGGPITSNCSTSSGGRSPRPWTSRPFARRSTPRSVASLPPTRFSSRSTRKEATGSGTPSFSIAAAQARHSGNPSTRDRRAT